MGKLSSINLQKEQLGGDNEKDAQTKFKYRSKYFGCSVQFPAVSILKTSVLDAGKEWIAHPITYYLA